MPSHTLSPGAESPLGLFAETSSSLSLPSPSDDGKSIIYNQEDGRQPMDIVAGKGDVKSSSSSSSLAASPSARAMLTTTSHDDESTVRGKNNKEKKEKKKTGIKKREICKKVAEVTGISVEIVCCFVSLSMVLLISTVSMILTWPLKLGLQSFFWRYESFVERWDGTTPDDYLLAPLWKWCSRTGPFASFIGAATFPGVLGLIFYFISCLPMFILDLMERYGGFRGMEDYKIRGKGRPTSDLGDWRRVLGYTFTTMILYIFPGLLFQFLTRGPWLYYIPSKVALRIPSFLHSPLAEQIVYNDTNSSQFPSPMICLFFCDGFGLFPSSAPSVLELAVQVILSLVIFDGCYYLWHRTHHEDRLLYRCIHSLHHQYYVPFVWVTQYAHPCELFAVTMFTFTSSIGLGCHPLSQWLWIMLSIQISVEAHGGYDLPWNLDRFLLRWVPLGGAQHHDLHHQYPRTNFQPFFTYFDRLCGTDCKTQQKEVERMRLMKAQ